MNTEAMLESLKSGKPMSAVPDMEEDVEQEETEIDIKSLKTHGQIDKLVADFELTVADNWSSMTISEKKSWLESEYGDEEPEEVAEPTPPSETGLDAIIEEGVELVKEVPVEIPVIEPQVAIVQKDEKIASEPLSTTKKQSKKSKATAVEQFLSNNDMDDMQSVVGAIESLDRESVLSSIEVLDAHSNYAMFKLGGLMARVKEEGWFDPHPSFQDWAYDVHGIAKRKALYWISIYTGLVNSEVSFSSVAHLKWSKLKEIVTVMDAESAEHWISVAEENSVPNLVEIVKQHKKSQLAKLTDEGEDTESEAAVKKVVTKSFKLYEDQADTVNAALDRMKEDAGIDENNGALERICLEYLSSTGGGLSKDGITTMLKKMGAEEALTIITEAFPDLSISVDE